MLRAVGRATVSDHAIMVVVGASLAVGIYRRLEFVAIVLVMVTAMLEAAMRAATMPAAVMATAAMAVTGLGARQCQPDAKPGSRI
jgi:hypothetical protein